MASNTGDITPTASDGRARTQDEAPEQKDDRARPPGVIRLCYRRIVQSRVFRRSALGVALIGAVSFLGNFATILTLFEPEGASSEQIDSLKSELTSQRLMIARLLEQTAPEFEPVDRGRLETRQAAATRVALAAPDAAGALASGDLRAGFEELQNRAAARSDDAAQAWRDLGALAYDRDPAIALDAYRRATEIDPSNGAGWMALANLEYDQAGDISAAITAAGKALAVSEDPLARLQAATVIAEFEFDDGQYTAARQRLDETVTAYRLLLAGDPTHDGYRHGLSDALWARGNLELEVGDLKSSEQSASELLAISRARLADRSEDSDRQLDVATALESVALVALERGDLDKAEAAFAESLALDRDRVARQPTSVSARRDLSVSLERYGWVLMELGRAADGVPFLEESVHTSRVLTGENPSHFRFREDLAYALDELGTAHMAADQPEAAAAAFLEAHTILRALHAEDPTDSGRALVLVSSLVSLADIMGTNDTTEEISRITDQLAKMSSLEEAELSELADIQEWLSERAP